MKGVMAVSLALLISHDDMAADDIIRDTDLAYE